MIFEANHIYTVNPDDRCLDLREGSVRLMGEGLRHDTMALSSFALAGLDRNDLAVFGEAMDEFGVSEQGLLVVSTTRNIGKVASAQAVELSTELQTEELARKCATLHEHELAQLGIDSIVAQLRQQYPDIDFS